MKIAVISDIHNDLHNLEKAVQRISEKQCDAIFALGDYVNTQTVKYLAENITLQAWAVFGNNDFEQDKMKSIASGKIFFPADDQQYLEVKMNYNIFALTHYPDIALELARYRKYTAVFHGHTHQKSADRSENIWIINPGPVSSLHLGKKVQSTFLIYNTELNDIEFIDLI